MAINRRTECFDGSINPAYLRDPTQGASFYPAVLGAQKAKSLTMPEWKLVFPEGHGVFRGDPVGQKVAIGHSIGVTVPAAHS